MDTLHFTTPADLVSLIGHSLGYWPHEGVVCISLQDSRMGATLSLDLPTTPDHALMYARKVGGYLRSVHIVHTPEFAFLRAPKENRVPQRGNAVLLFAVKRGTTDGCAPS